MQWVSVNKELPMTDELVIVRWIDSDGESCFRCDRYLYNKWYIDHCDEEYTHWAIIPEPPHAD